MRIRLFCPALLLVAASLLCAALVQAAEPCPPCLAFDRLDRQVRDNLLSKSEAQQLFATRVAALDEYLAHTAGQGPDRSRWVFPLRGYTLAESGADAARGYIAAGYDYFDGNRHGGHPSFDLFIHDRNRDSLDDRTGQPVTIVSMTAGIVVAAEPAWSNSSTLRGGKYLWIYDPAEKLLVYYAHNFELLVGVGDRVEPGTPIATVGRSGFNAAKQRSPTHLHLTILRVENGQPVPDNLLPLLRRLPSLPRK